MANPNKYRSSIETFHQIKALLEGTTLCFVNLEGEFTFLSSEYWPREFAGGSDKALVKVQTQKGEFAEFTFARGWWIYQDRLLGDCSIVPTNSQ